MATDKTVGMLAVILMSIIGLIHTSSFCTKCTSAALDEKRPRSSPELLTARPCRTES